MTKGLDEILSGDEPAQVEKSSAPEPAPDAQTPAPEAQPSPAEPPAPEPSAEEKQSGMVPQKALHASRERARTAEERAADLERQLAELQGKVSVLSQLPKPQPQPAPEPPKPVDFWEDPNKFVEAALSPVEQRIIATTYRASRAEAIAEYGKDVVASADAALKAALESGELNPESVAAQLRNSGDPVGDVVRWHQNSPANKEAELREKIRAELLAEQGNAPAPQPAPQIVNPEPTVMPSNLVGQRNVGTRSGPAWSGPAPINDIFDRARAKKAG